MNDATYARIPWLRKAESWKEAEGYVAPADLDLTGIPEFPAEPDPMRTFSMPRPRFFIAVRPGGDRFLVNTEGYDYGRYVAALPKESK